MRGSPFETSEEGLHKSTFKRFLSAFSSLLYIPVVIYFQRISPESLPEGHQRGSIINSAAKTISKVPE